MRISSLSRKWMVCTVLFPILSCAWLIPAWAQEGTTDQAAQGPTATVSTDFLSQYIFRGVANTANGAVMQPSLTLGYQGISVNIWGNADLSTKTDGRQKWTETDVTASYTREVIKDFSLTAGMTHYFLPTANFDATEIFGGGSYNFPWLTVGFTAYREVSYYPGWWFELDFSKSIPLPYYGMSLDLAASFGYLILDNDNNALNQTFSDPGAGQILVDLKIPIGKIFSISPKVGVSFPLSTAESHYLEASSVDNQDTHVFGGVNITAAW